MRWSSMWAWVLAAAPGALLALALVLRVLASSHGPRWWEVVLAVMAVLSSASIGLLVVVWREGWLLLASGLIPATGLLSSASMVAGSRGTPAQARCDLGGACGP